MGIFSEHVTVLVAAGTLALIGVPPASATPDPGWGACAKPVAPGVECGTLTVPVDWAKPGGGTVGLRVYRWKAENSKGTILGFPSGPGQPGDYTFGTLRRALPGYDLISLDPRGVGESHPMTCDVDKILKIPYVPPTDAGAFEALKQNQKAFWSTCTTGVENLDDHLDAYSTASDADALRRAVGARKVSVYGLSYGTLLGERYLEKFGRHVDGSVLEGVMNPGQDRREFMTTAAAGVEAIFTEFARWSDETPDSALHGQDPADVFRKARQNAARLPGTFYGLPWSEVMITRYFEIFAPRDFGEVAKGLKELAEGRNPFPDEPGGEVPPRRLEYADPTTCSDWPFALPNVEEARADLRSARKAAPVVGYSTNSSNYTSICVGGPKTGRPKPVSSRSASPTLLLSNSLDPATPKVWAEKVQEQLGGKAIHVVTERVGHGGGMEDPVTLKKVQDYMASTTRP
ncbi:alpha/beta fold hydrolase [Lentzea albidocapillata]|uniref:Alpha/beta hydrolase fold n=1 Tax=Lentzea albidocapillata TaxID=40571 RepID=A0A1W2BYQ5_9PSEU|nr:alpha/beta fold hydrolase [Lentzea albidocapillata]SMC78030.1 alpha/beta hydrolase fold [Lentzea albidocapillata]